MKKEYILVIDSGIGGLSTLSVIKNHLNANFIYFADVKNSPYGLLSQKNLAFNLCKIIEDKLFNYNIKVVVLACNTATTNCIEFLRAKYPKLVFIGTEPAVKLAFLQGHKKILAITTPATARQEKYLKLVKNCNCDVKTIAMPKLATTIENYYNQNSHISYANLLREVFFVAKSAKNFDAVVLGCTHYVFIKQILQKITNKPCLDGNHGVAKQILRKTNNKHTKKLTKSRITFDNSYSTKFAKEKYKKILSQILAKLENMC